MKYLLPEIKMGETMFFTRTEILEELGWEDNFISTIKLWFLCESYKGSSIRLIKSGNIYLYDNNRWSRYGIDRGMGPC